MHRKRKMFLAAFVVVILVLAFLRRKNNINNNTISKNNRRFEVRSVLRPLECKREIVWLVHSRLTNFEARRVIRESYSFEELDALGVDRVFVLGVDASYQQYLNRESESTGNHNSVIKRDIYNINSNVAGRVAIDRNTKINNSINRNGNVINKNNSNINTKNDSNISGHEIPAISIARTQLLIMEEQQRYADILQTDFLDTYRNLTLKHVSGLNYTIAHCPKILHIFKSDDDVIVDVPGIVRLIKRHFSNGNGNVRGNSNGVANEYVINKANIDINNSSSVTGRTICTIANISSNSNCNISKSKTNSSIYTKSNNNTGNTRSIGPTSRAILNPEKTGAHIVSDSSISNTSKGNSSTSTSLHLNAELNIFGYKMTNKLVERNPDSKWFVTAKEYNGNYYPSFVSGWLYFTSKLVIEALLENYIEYTRKKEVFWIDDVFVTGMLRDGTAVEVVGLNEMYAVDYRYLQCCVKDMSRNLHCDYAVGPDGGRRSLHKEFKEYLDYCEHRCRQRTKENSVKNTCIVAYDRDESIGDGKPVVEPV